MRRKNGVGKQYIMPSFSKPCDPLTAHTSHQNCHLCKGNDKVSTTSCPPLSPGSSLGRHSFWWSRSMVQRSFLTGFYRPKGIFSLARRNWVIKYVETLLVFWFVLPAHLSFVSSFSEDLFMPALSVFYGNKCNYSSMWIFSIQLPLYPLHSYLCLQNCVPSICVQIEGFLFYHGFPNMSN